MKAGVWGLSSRDTGIFRSVRRVRGEGRGWDEGQGVS